MDFHQTWYVHWYWDWFGIANVQILAIFWISVFSLPEENLSKYQSILWNLVCALILYTSGLELPVGKFHQFLTVLHVSARHTSGGVLSIHVFFYFSDPNGSGLPKWPKYNSSERYYMNLNIPPVAAENVYADRMKFWIEIVPNITAHYTKAPNNNGQFSAVSKLGYSTRLHTLLSIVILLLLSKL